MKKRISLVIGLLATTIVIAAAQDAPLGLTWGISSSAIRSQGADLADFDKLTFGKSYLATKLEMAVSDQDGALLSFGFNDKLWRIMIMSREFTNDPHGSAVLARYNELLKVLTEKYGKAKQVHRLGGSIYSESRYFLAGIRGGESSWHTDFDAPSISVQLAISANDSSTGRWRLFYTYKPLEKEFEASKRSREKGAL